MSRISPERRQSIIQKMMPPMNIRVKELAEQEGISEATLYNWRSQSRLEGMVVPGNGKNPDQWSSEEKFAVVLEAAPLNEAELAEYCRKKGLFKEQITQWKAACLQANASSQEQQKLERERKKQDKKRIRTLEKELHRKEKALAETAALLALRKKLNALWGEEDEEN